MSINFLLKLAKQKNLKLIGLNYKDNDIKAKKFLNELGNPYSIILLDNNGTLAIDWETYGVPETFNKRKNNKENNWTN